MANDGFGGPPAGGNGPGGFGGPPGGQPPGGGFGVPPGGGGFGVPPGGAAPPGSFGAPPSGQPAGGGAWTPTDSIQAAFELVKAKPVEVLLPLIVAMVITMVPGIAKSIVSQIVVAIAAAADEEGVLALIAMFGTELVFSVLSLAVQAYVTAGTIVFSLKLLRGEDASFGDIFSGGPYVLRLMGMFVLMGLAILFGWALCIVPGVILALGLSMASPMVVDRHVGPIDAMKASWDLTTGHKGNLFVFYLLCAVVVLLGMLACCVGLFVAQPIITLAWVLVYKQLNGR